MNTKKIKNEIAVKSLINKSYQNENIFNVDSLTTTAHYLYIACLLIHLSLIFIFGYLGVKILSIFNIGSVVFWGFAIFLNRRGKLLPSAFVGITEATAHAIICVLVIGWNSGFYVYIFIIIIGLSILNIKRLINKIFLILLNIIGLCFLSFFSQYIDPITPIDPIFLILFQIVNLSLFAGLLTVIGYYFSNETAKAQAALEHERMLSENLLNNILPPIISERLKNSSEKIADGFHATTILFADIVDFTIFSSKISPHDLVSILNQIFSLFDALTEKYGLEKIKTIGDAYMVASGIPVARDDHVKIMAELALDMKTEIQKFNEQNSYSFQLRIGIHTGEAVAGVIGVKKFIYDLWGDTVNTASRMESTGVPGEIQVSEITHKLLKDTFIFEERGEIEVKGKGLMKTYFLKDKVQ